MNNQNWAPEAKVAYEDDLKCFINQYSQYRAKNVEDLLGDGKPFYLNGQLTIREDVADNGGVKLAYNAYKKWIKENGAEKELIGLPFNPNQLFWMSFAQSYCSVERAGGFCNLDQILIPNLPSIFQFK